jgi:hypothetical protein
MFNKLYLLFGAACLSFYGAAGVMGWEFGGYGRESPQQAQARHASGGTRSVWIHSYYGGK